MVAVIVSCVMNLADPRTLEEAYSVWMSRRIGIMRTGIIRTNSLGVMNYITLQGIDSRSIAHPPAVKTHILSVNTMLFLSQP